MAMEAIAAHSSRHTFGQHACPRGGTILNYIWISPNISKTIPQSLCSVPLHYMDMAFQNAQRYPDASFRIWFDFSLLDASSIYFVKSHFSIFAPENITLHDLSDRKSGIPFYRDEKYFAPNMDRDNSGIWARVDLARLVVLQHCFQTTPAENVFYADFDTDDVDLDKRRVRSRLNKYGVVVARTRKDCFENNFIGLRRDPGMRLLAEKFIPQTIELFAQKNGYVAFLRVMNEFCKSKGLTHPWSSAVGIDITKPMGYKLPKNPAYDYLN